MDVAGTAEQWAASLVRNRRWDKESLQTPEHQSRKICIYQSVFYQVAKISASEFSSDRHACRRNPWNELLQWLPANPAMRDK